ncbi:Conserved_hypothetical protein [Hexamita inflata]|uniref:Transmembrane protein n=1 Tax=Hexamita inflata TaxID=28002 RepID=A0AA86QJ19_9EUKA|nr:Conserved hypothetical protein [Hexamita inflata]
MLLISIFAAVPLDTDGREIHTCYTYDTSVEYRPNIKQLLILLVPSNNSACDIFPAGVNINVTIGNTDFATTVPLPVYLPYSYTISNFGYQNTTQIAVEGFSLPVDGLGDEISIDFLLIEIYSYAEITRIEILEMQTIISSLSECFYADMPMLVKKGQLQITMNATGLCRIQIGNLKSLEVTIEGKQFSFAEADQASLTSLKNTYNHNVLFNIVVVPVGITDPFAFTAEKPDIAATAYLVTEQSGIQTRIDLKLSSQKFDSIPNFYEASYVTMNDKQFIFTLIPKVSSQIALATALAATGKTYNKIIARVIMQVGSLSYTFEQLGAVFDPKQIHLQFSCQDMPSNQLQQCLDFYTASAKATTGKITISALFYYNDLLLISQHDVIPFKPQQFERVLFNVKKDQEICIDLQNSRDPTFDASAVSTFKFYVIKASNYDLKGDYSLQSSYNNVQTQVCFNNSQLRTDALDDFIAMLTISQGAKTVTQVFTSSQTTDSNKINMASFTLIGIFAGIAFVQAIYQLIRFQKQLKALKKKKTG